MPRPIITLTTDFGLSDHFVGAMKGVILKILPGAAIVDICHGIGPFQIPEAAFAISQAYPCFPGKTVHVVVVDPGVGTQRRPILAEAAGQYFVAPDNGVLSMIFSREKCKVRQITASRYFLSPVSATFHGRDIFAPVAARLAKGIPPARFGRLIQDALRSTFEKPVRTGKRFWSGTVLKVDHFGNLITNFRLDQFPEISSRPFQMKAGLLAAERLASSYAEGIPGELILIPGSSGYLEVALNKGSAARKLACGAGSPVELVLL
jgi:hypothetical protein